MERLLKNSKEFLSLPKDHKRDFLDQLYQFLIDDHATVVDYQKLKIKSTAAICPNCKSENVIKAGTRKGRQIYIYNFCIYISVYLCVYSFDNVFTFTVWTDGCCRFNF